MPWPSASSGPAAPVLCYVTDRHGFGGGDAVAIPQLVETIARAARAGVDAIQIREKDLSGRALLDLAEQAARENQATKILINDRMDVALAAGAAGVHLGGESVAVADAVEFGDKLSARVASSGGFLIGRSCHSLDEVLAAERDGADYVFFGPVFATPSKERFGVPQGIEALRTVCGRAKIPVFAIGGISLENAVACVKAGARGIAAIRLFQGSEDLTAVVGGFKE
jgi:thiamine-phosphate pyrophosphorylase